MLVVDPTTQRSLVVRQSDESDVLVTDVLIKPQSAICPSTPSPKQSSELRCPPPLQGIVLFGVYINRHQLENAVAADSVARVGILWGIIALRVRWQANLF